MQEEEATKQEVAVVAGNPPKRPTKVYNLVLGAVKGNVNKALAKVAALHKGKAGPFDAVFCVGQFLTSAGCTSEADDAAGQGSAQEKTAEEELADFQRRADESELKDYLNGTKEAVLPTYFVEQVVHPQAPQSWGNVTRLAGFGNVEVCGLNVAYYTLVRPNPESGQWVRSESGRGTDVLLTNEWPYGVLKNLATENYPKSASSESSADSFMAWASIGSPIVAHVVEGLCPRYHFAPSEKDVFYERPPYANPSGLITRFLTIAPFDNQVKQKFLYAASLAPVRDMDKESLFKQPANTTVSPFVPIPRPQSGILPTHNRPRPRFEEQEPPHKRQRGESRGRGEGRGRGRGEAQQRRDDRGFGENCWFCLKSPQVEKHLVVSVGNEVYVTLAKGQLVPDHVLLIPIAHLPAVASAPEGVREELEKYKKSLREYLKTKGQTMILFERFLNKNHHCHIQVVPIPERDAEKAKEFIIAEGAKRNVPFDPISVSASDIGEVLESEQPYITIELPSGEVLLHAIGRQRVPMELGRELIAALIGKPERSEWKACVLSKAEETKEAATFKKEFKPFDWSFE